MSKKLSFLLLCMCVTVFSFAQNVRIKWKQLSMGVTGQVAMVGTDGNGAWLTPPFMVYTDTTNLIATKTNVNVALLKEIISATFANGVLTLTKANGTIVTANLDGRYVLQSSIGQPNGITPLDADGKVPSAFLPPIASRETYVVGNESEMLSLTAVQGDMAIRTDLNQTFVMQCTDPSSLDSWVLLPNPANPTPVTSVNNKVGNVVLNTDNIAEGTTNQYFTTSRVRASVNAAAPIAYNSTTGVISHATSGVTNGTYNTVTVDAFGHVTAGSNTAFVTPSTLTTTINGLNTVFAPIQGSTNYIQNQAATKQGAQAWFIKSTQDSLHIGGNTAMSAPFQVDGVGQIGSWQFNAQDMRFSGRPFMTIGSLSTDSSLLYQQNPWFKYITYGLATSVNKILGTIKINTPPTGDTTDMILVRRASDSTIRQIPISAIPGNGSGGSVACGSVISMLNSTVNLTAGVTSVSIQLPSATAVMRPFVSVSEDGVNDFNYSFDGASSTLRIQYDVAPNAGSVIFQIPYISQ